MRGILADTIAEMIDRKMVWVFAAVTLLGLLIVLAARSLEIQFQSEGMDMQSMNEVIGSPLLWLYNKFMYYLVFLSVMVTAGLIPSMLVKGRVDYYLSKPLSRRQYILTKMASVWIVYSGLMFAVMLVVGGAGALAFSVVDTGIVFIILINLLIFFVWLVVTTFVGVWTASAPMSILAVFLLWILQMMLYWLKGLVGLLDSPIWQRVADISYYIVPKTIDISDSTLQLIGGGSFAWTSLYTTLAFAVVLMYFTVFMFNRKNY